MVAHDPSKMQVELYILFRDYLSSLAEWLPNGPT
jgi:hypothetical protein